MLGKVCKDSVGARLRCGADGICILAFLSASGTSRGCVTLVDEAITVAGAFQSADHRDVVGTPWSIDHELAPPVADYVYGALTQAGGEDPDVGDTAVALDAAIHANRKSSGLYTSPATA